MYKSTIKYFLGLFFGLCSIVSQAQTTISGTVKDENKEELIGVNILVKGTVLGTITDVMGNFNLSITSSPPITLVITSVGYERQEIEINSANVTGLDLTMKESTLLGQEVVVSASRVEESILESPVSIEKMDILAVQNAASDTYYKAIANLKGVDVTSSSINFQIINARGFGSTGNTRFVQLIDGMDTQAPALNFPIGNLNGPSELDVESVELIPGASSALYGPNAFNGVLLINSKSPFDYQGLSAFTRFGVNHVGSNADQSAAPMFESSIRYAKAFNNKLAFKVNFSYMRADDWNGTDSFDRNSAFNPLAGVGGVNPGADRLHFMGDEAGINLAIFPFSSGFNAVAKNANFSNNRTAFDYSSAGDLPSHVANITPYKEADLIDYGAENIKVSTGINYRLSDKMELSYLLNYGGGTSIYTGAQRYSLSNFAITQHRLQLRGDNFMVRAYGTIENSGDSYITEFLAKRVNDLVVGYKNIFWYNGGKGSLTGYLVDYGVEYLRSLAEQGYAPGEINTLTGDALINAQNTAHSYARQTVDEKYILDPKTGTVVDPSTGKLLTLKDIKKIALNGVVPDGPKFNDQSAMYQAEGQYDFKNQISFMDVQMGASFRMFDLGSNGTIFPDTAGNEITIKEYGVYTQASKRLNNFVKLSGSLRYDKNENFKGVINPRISSVFTVNETHNFRMSYQTGFRIPTTQGQYINLDVISSRLLGGLPEFYDQYFSDPQNNYYYQLGSVLEWRNRVFGGESFDAASSSLVRYEQKELTPVKPEKVKSFEIGYKSLVDNKLLIDAVYFYNIYNSFITQIGVVVADKDASGNPVFSSILNSTSDDTYSIYTNLDNVVKTQGAAIGVDYILPGEFRIGSNYSWNKFIEGYTDNNLQDFNTPEHKINVNFGNRKLIDNLGFNITYRWQDNYLWESSFARGEVPAYGTVDAMVSYKLSSIKSVLKLGGSNILNQSYFQSLGGPNIGAIYYLSLTFDQKMN